MSTELGSSWVLPFLPLIWRSLPVKRAPGFIRLLHNNFVRFFIALSEYNIARKQHQVFHPRVDSSQPPPPTSFDSLSLLSDLVLFFYWDRSTLLASNQSSSSRICSSVIGPARKILNLSVVRSTTVEGKPPGVLPPSSTRSTRPLS